MSTSGIWRCRDRELATAGRTLVMGIVNVTPDSFSDGGAFGGDPERAAAHGVALVREGADVVDVGGESTRPGSDPVEVNEELERVVPVVQRLVKQVDVPVSIDTRRAEVAEAALEVGASIVNDVTAGSDPRMLRVVAGSGAGLVLMHMLGEPKTMQDDPRYQDVVAEVRAFLAERADSAVAAGVERERLCVDPGIGFGKTVEHNLQLLRSVASFGQIGAQVAIGASRKRFIGSLTGQDDSRDRLEGSLAVAVWVASQGVDVVRVHDVAATVRALRVLYAIRGAGS
jgi:dihydropteroate synthase